MARKAKNSPVESKEKELEVVEASDEALFGEEDLENSGLRELVDKRSRVSDLRGHKLHAT